MNRHARNAGPFEGSPFSTDNHAYLATRRGRPGGLFARMAVLLPASIAALGFASYLAFSHAQSAPRRALTADQIVQSIDAAVNAHENAIAGYTVNDHYTLYVGQDPEAEKIVTVAFNRDTGKTITPISQSGNPLLISAIIDQVLNSELELSSPQARASVLIDSDNYEMSPEPALTEMNGRECIVVDLRARRSSTSLFNGKAWIDARNFDFVHLEGSPSEAPNVLVGDITFTRDYATIDGLNMPVHAESHARSPLLGDTVLTIDSTNYQIQH